MSTNNPTDNNKGKPDTMSQEEWDKLPVSGRDGKKGKKDYFEENELMKLQQKTSINKEKAKAKSEAQLDEIKQKIAKEELNTQLALAQQKRASVNKAERDRKYETRQATIKSITTPIKERTEILMSGIESLIKVVGLSAVIIFSPAIFGTVGGSAFFGIGAVIGGVLGGGVSLLAAAVISPFLLASVISTVIGTFIGLVTGKSPSVFKRFSDTLKNGMSKFFASSIRAVSKKIDPEGKVEILNKINDQTQASEIKGNEGIIATAAGSSIAAKETTIKEKEATGREETATNTADSVALTSATSMSPAPTATEQVTQVVDSGTNTSGEVLKAIHTTAKLVQNVTDNSLARSVVGAAASYIPLGQQAVQALTVAAKVAKSAEEIANKENLGKPMLALYDQVKQARKEEAKIMETQKAQEKSQESQKREPQEKELSTTNDTTTHSNANKFK